MMRVPSNTIVVFAPGAWNPSSAYDEFRQLLSQRDISSVAIDHLSNGAEPPNKGLRDDSKHLRQILTDLADQGKRILLVGHSYGGMVISAASTGLGLEERTQAGKSGGVIRLVYMAAFVAPRGRSLKDMINGELWPWMLVQGNYVRRDPAVDLIQDVPDEVKEKLSAALHGHICLAAFLEPSTDEPWRTIPSAYIVCDEDRALPPAIQMIRSLIDPQVFRLKSGHSPFLSMPNETAEILEQLCQ
ncbi:alpha/beta hydrolase [Aspergillus fijiensis CBS 313.89]|uniref:Alpha/beta-hydrolase n=1 Tax=Aspergillus fijiensis CBS 313.89 TaxID=1448319 RepID=A0A8G1RS23_9EURO|nr:alpha/beta-hydrolase [Aspergillus fijiensis CBS 313.89]RAK78249.1 alpha/beta-hydrolase [Aspergillus fijiensis CBS 313.89]